MQALLKSAGVFKTSDRVTTLIRASLLPDLLVGLVHRFMSLPPDKVRWVGGSCLVFVAYFTK